MPFVATLRLAMGVVYSLYDALVSINVPDEKAKAVIDALEREMIDKLATKADLASLQAVTKADLASLQAVTKADVANFQAVLKADVANLQAVLKADVANVQTVMKADFASLQAITKAELTSVRDVVSKDLEMLRSDMKHLGSDLDGRIGKLKSDLTIVFGSMAAASVALTCTILGTILALR